MGKRPANDVEPATRPSEGGHVVLCTASVLLTPAGPAADHVGDATRFVRKHRFDDAPFAVAEFIAHELMLQFWSLNHAQDQEINGQTACPLLEGERTYRGHREIDAIDPRQTFCWLEKRRVGP